MTASVGEIKLLGKHRLGCGDIRQQDALDALMAGAEADAAFLDPPYNVPIDAYATGRGQFRHRVFEVASGGCCQSNRNLSPIGRAIS
jgi:DNA modification methylase